MQEPDPRSPPGKFYTKKYGTVKWTKDGWLACAKGHRFLDASCDVAIGWVMASNNITHGV